MPASEKQKRHLIRARAARALKRFSPAAIAEAAQLSQTGMSRNAIARAIGCPPATLSAYMKKAEMVYDELGGDLSGLDERQQEILKLAVAIREGESEAVRTAYITLAKASATNWRAADALITRIESRNQKNPAAPKIKNGRRAALTSSRREK